MSRYYYSPDTKRYYKHVYSVVVDTILAPSRIRSTIMMYSIESYKMLSDPQWCDTHEDDVCDLLGLYKTITKFRIELAIRMALYNRMIERSKKEE